MSNKIAADVLIVGSGPVGCAFARTLVEGGRSVLMIDAGSSLSPRLGSHLKNAFMYQRDVNLFSYVIQGHLHLLSVPTNRAPTPTLDPGAFAIDRSNPKYAGFISNNENPDQDPSKNLGAAAAAYKVGGMATHWTCSTPRLHPSIERSTLLSDAEWNGLYERAERLLHTRNDAFENSIRNTVVRRTLEENFPELEGNSRPQNLRLAVERREDNDELVTWSGADTVLGPLAEIGASSRFTVLEQHRCKRLHLSPDDQIEYAEVEDLVHWDKIEVHANNYVICAGAVLTPQILFASGVRPLALGRYLSEQPMAFCQIVLKQSIVDAMVEDPAFKDRINEYQAQHPEDPIPIPINDPDPQLWIPVSERRPWHCQIHRDAFHYGLLPPNVDDRLIVDLRWFGIVKQRFENRVTFSETHHDTFGMPQPTFHYELEEDDRKIQHEMMKDMLRAAGALGGFLPGSEPQFMTPGLALHIHGTTRIGDSPRAASRTRWERYGDTTTSILAATG